MEDKDWLNEALASMHSGQWFGWSDSKNKIYANLIVHDGGSKPSESDCTTGLAALQSAWDEENKQYKLERISSYEGIGEQLDQLYHDMKDGKLGVAATTGSWFVGISSVKTAIAKT